jgi:hypothetical protein
MSQGTAGQGCWASVATLAEKCCANYNNVSTALNELGGFGYIASSPHPNDKRRRVHRVVYTDADNILTNTSPIGEPSAKDVSPQANNAAMVVRPEASENEGIVRPENCQALETSGELPLNIFRRNGIEDIPQKRSLIHSAEAGPRNGHTANGILAAIQRKIKSPKPLTATELQGFRETVSNILDQSESGSLTYGWAEKVLFALDDRQAA